MLIEDPKTIEIDEAEINDVVARATEIEQRQLEEMREFNSRRKELLKEYYDNAFPYQAIYDWLSYGNKPLSKMDGYDHTYFSRREIAYIVMMDNGTDEYCTRHQCYRNVAEFKADVHKLIPLRIDIGAVFDLEPRTNR